jgi:hypothetical protein
MYFEFERAKQRHAELDAKYNHPQEFDGVTVPVPNILDRMVMALVRRGSHDEHILQPTGHGRVQVPSIIYRAMRALQATLARRDTTSEKGFWSLRRGAGAAK